MTFVWQRGDTATNFALTNAAPISFSYAKIGSIPPGKSYVREILLPQYAAFVDASAGAFDYPNAPWTNFSVHALVMTHGSPNAPFPLDPTGNPPPSQDYLWRQGMAWASDWNDNVADFTQFRSPVDGRPIDTLSKRKANSVDAETALWYVWHVSMVVPAGVTISVDLTLSFDLLEFVP